MPAQRRPLSVPAPLPQIAFWGGGIGVAKTGWDMVKGLGTLGGSAVLMTGDILTFGYNHDNETIQQAWLTMGALGYGVKETVAHPVDTAKAIATHYGNRYEEAQRLRAQGDELGAAVVNSNATAEIALAVLGGTELAAQTPKLARTGVAMVRGEAMGAEVLAASTQKAATVERAVLSTEQTVTINAITRELPERILARNIHEPPLNSSNLSMGVERASPELIQNVTRKREVVIAEEGASDMAYLDWMGAEANVGGETYTHILHRPNPSKAAVLEEFLHGTQYRLGIIDKLGTSGLGSAETHVKGFLIRHQRILDLSIEDLKILQELKDAGL